MVKKLLALLSISFLAAGCSLTLPDMNSTNQPEEAKEKQNTKEESITQEEVESVEEFDLSIASIGDSLTKGVGDESEKGGYTPFLLDRLEEDKEINEIEFTHYGKRGLSTEGLLGKFEDNTIQPVIRHADIVIITIGGNDVMNIAKKNYRSLKMTQFTDGINEYEENIRTIIEKIRGTNPETDIYFVGLYNPWRQWLADVKEFGSIMQLWNERTKQVAESHERVFFVEISHLFEEGDDNLIFEEDYFHPNTKGYQLMGNAIFEEVQKNSLPNFKNES